MLRFQPHRQLPQPAIGATSHWCVSPMDRVLRLGQRAIWCRQGGILPFRYPHRLGCWLSHPWYVISLHYFFICYLLFVICYLLFYVALISIYCNSVYSGDKDLICNYVGGINLLQSMRWPGQNNWIAASNVTWNVQGQVAGWAKASGPLTWLQVT